MSSKRYNKMHKMYSLKPFPDGEEVIRFYSKSNIINPIIAKGNKFADRIAHD